MAYLDKLEVGDILLIDGEVVTRAYNITDIFRDEVGVKSVQLDNGISSFDFCDVSLNTVMGKPKKVSKHDVRIMKVSMGNNEIIQPYLREE